MIFRSISSLGLTALVLAVSFVAHADNHEKGKAKSGEAAKGKATPAAPAVPPEPVDLNTISTDPAVDYTEDFLLEALASDETILESKARACDYLGNIGTAKSVPVLAALLTDDQLHDYARDGLARIQDPVAGEALLASLETLQGRQKIGVIISLGDRGDEDAIPALKTVAEGKNPTAYSAAMTALGQIASDQASEVLVGLVESSAGPKAVTAAEAALLAAQNRAAMGRPVEALNAAVKDADVPDLLKKAAD